MYTRTCVFAAKKKQRPNFLELFHKAFHAKCSKQLRSPTLGTFASPNYSCLKLLSNIYSASLSTRLQIWESESLAVLLPDLKGFESRGLGTLFTTVGSVEQMILSGMTRICRSTSATAIAITWARLRRGRAGAVGAAVAGLGRGIEGAPEAQHLGNQQIMGIVAKYGHFHFSFLWFTMFLHLKISTFCKIIF